MISINWQTKVIFIPQNDLTFVSGVLYELDINWFRLQLKNIEDSELGMIFPNTHNHNTESVLSGVTYARIFQILSPYTVDFESKEIQYVVRCVGANHNLADVKVPNNVSLIIGNSSGLIVSSASPSLNVQQTQQMDTVTKGSRLHTMLLLRK